MEEDIEQRIDALRLQIEEWNYHYYVLAESMVSDFEFDRTLKELERLEEENPEFYDPNSPTQRVGCDINRNFVQVKHVYPMLSLANAYSKGEVIDFYNHIRKKLYDPFEIVCELKYDGISISLTYENGVLTRAVTRGDGTRGDDVTTNVRTIKSIPLHLYGCGYPDYFEIRGEILLPWTTFNRLNEERIELGKLAFANPRNAAAGTLKTLNPKVVAQRQLDSFLYYLLGENLPEESHYENLLVARSWGFKISDAMRKCRTLDEVFDFINYWDKERGNLPVATDGIVLKVNSLQQQRNLGFTSRSPRWAIAYKFCSESTETRLNSVEFQIGRTGTVTPVANLEPILLSGTIVRRASLYNADIIEELDLHIGDMCYVEKGGEIIPKITGVNKEVRFIMGDKVQFIRNCPFCGTPLFRESGEVVYCCPNHNGCEPQIKGLLEHFASRKAMDINAGEETIDVLYKAGLLRSVADWYELTRPIILRLEHWAEKSTSNLLKSIEQSKKIPYERVLYALGIHYVGETVAKRLTRAFPNIDKLMQASLEQLMAINEIGERIAGSVIKYFADIRNQQLIERLRRHGLQFTLNIETLTKKHTDVLRSKTFVISGVFTKHSRDEYKDMIEKNGGKSTVSLSARTDFILAGKNLGLAKLKKATKLGVRIISEQEFLDMM